MHCQYIMSPSPPCVGRAYRHTRAGVSSTVYTAVYGQHGFLSLCCFHNSHYAQLLSATLQRDSSKSRHVTFIALLSDPVPRPLQDFSCCSHFWLRLMGWSNFDSRYTDPNYIYRASACYTCRARYCF